MSPHGLALGVALALLTGPVGCATTQRGDPLDGADLDRAATLLERQRSDVRAAARAMLRGAERRLVGSTAHSTGAWRGCESAGAEQYRNFRYLAQAGVDVPPGAPGAKAAALRRVLEDAGFTAADAGPAGHRSAGHRSAGLTGTRGDLTAVLAARGAVVGLDVYGPCIDVPEDERDAWLRRDEPTPDLLRR